MRGKFLVVAAVLLSYAMIWYGCTGDDPVRTANDTNYPVEGDEGARLYEWAIGPIDGITTVWHEAPAEIAVPVGTTIRLKCADPTSTLSWSNASEVRKADGGSIAEVRIDKPGSIEISVESSGVGSGGGSKKRPAEFSSATIHSCVITGVDIAAKDIRVGDVAVATSATGITESSSNAETMQAFFGGGVRFQTISRVQRVSADHFVSAINRAISVSATAEDGRFSSLIEVRVPGFRPTLSTFAPILLSTIGTQIIDIGPTAHPKRATIDTYSVSITSHVSFKDLVAENQVVTFTARTNPAGFEDNITWLSSTKYGSATPVLGHGATFHVTFYFPWGLDETIPNQLYQWLGVRADNATFNQDQKPEYVKAFDVYPPGPFGKAPATGLPDIMLHLRVHCPKTPACIPSPASMAPAVGSSNVICSGFATCTSADAGVMAQSFATSLTTDGCAAAAAPSIVGNGVWRVVFTIPQACVDNVACSFSWGVIEVNSCLPIVTATDPLHNLCYGGTGDERDPWIGGWKIAQ